MGERPRDGWIYGLAALCGIVFGPGGKLYGTTLYGGILTLCYNSGCGTAVELTPNSTGGAGNCVIFEVTAEQISGPHRHLHCAGRRILEEWTGNN
jgi:hypothetical protein